MRNAARLAIVALALGTSAGNARAVTPLSLHLDGLSMERHGATVFVRAEARWSHRGATPIAGDTCCAGGAFDGLWLVVTDRRGRVLARVSHVAHQSPYASSNPFTLPPGETRRALVFPVDGLPAGRGVRVHLDGGVIGSARFGRGFATPARSARVP